MSIKNPKQARRQKIRYRIRKKVQGTTERPRLAVYKSNTAIYAQLIDDTIGHTIAAVDTRKYKGKTKAHASRIGEAIAVKAIEKKLQHIVFDRSGYPYHGVVKALFEAVRKKITHP